MQAWIMFGLVVAGILAAFIVLPLRNTARIKKRLRACFGKTPATVEGRLNAGLFWQSYSSAWPAPGHLDDWTWNDLDLDDVYGRVNACQSATGDIRLYGALREVTGEGLEKQVALREEMMARFEADVALREKVQLRLAQLGRSDGSGLEMAVFHPEAIALQRPWLYRLLAVLPLVAVAGFFVNIYAGVGLLFLALVVNFNVLSMVKLRNDSGFRSVRYLSAAITCAARLSKQLAEELPAVASALKAAQAQYAHLGWSVSLLNFSELMEQATSVDPTAMFLLPVLAYGRVAGQLRGKSADTMGLYRLLGEVDLAIALLSYRHSLEGYCLPKYTQRPRLEAEGVWHPLLEDAVPNSITLDNDLLLTGSNASGKSTFIKALALNCIMGQALNTCTASSFCFRRGLVATSMAVEDSVVDGDSYFVAEIKSMRRLMRLARQPAFTWYFIDEVLKGTNTIERIAASAAVLQRLHAAQGICVAATHDIELTGLLEEQYDNAHFRERVTEAGVVFDYRLHDGPATTRNALLLLRQMDYPDEVVEGAYALVARFEEKGDWGRLPPPQK